MANSVTYPVFTPQLGGIMFGKPRVSNADGTRACAMLVEAASRNDRSRIHQILTGPETTDAELESAMWRHFAIASAAPTVRGRLADTMNEVQPNAVPAFRSALAVIDTSEQVAFRPENAMGQIVLMACLAKIISDEDEALAILVDLQERSE